jgi:hypothetical protein
MFPMIYGRETVDSRHIVLLGIVFDTFAFALFMMNSKSLRPYFSMEDILMFVVNIKYISVQ